MNLNNQHKPVMKKSLYILSGIVFLNLLIATDANAQDNVFFVPDPETARWSYLESDADGKESATTFYSVGTMTGNAVNGSVKLIVERVTVSAPADTLKSFIFYKFKDGECMVDMNALFEVDVLTSMMESAAGEAVREASPEDKAKAIEEMKSRIQISGEMRGIPRYPKTGELPDYEFRFKFSVLSMTVKGTQRKISGKEKIATPAGVFDCFILEETATTKALMQKEVEKTVSWYAYGIGLVKNSTYDKKGKLVSTTVLNSINW